MTFPSTNATIARTDAAQTFAGTQTFTGNITNGAAAGGQIIAGQFLFAGQTGTATGGQTRYINDAGATNWLTGLLGTAGATNFSIYDLVNSASRLTINSSTGAVSVGITPAQTDNSANIATTSFVQTAVNGNQSISVAGSSNVTLTAAQSAAQIFTFTGALTGNINVLLAANTAKTFIVENSTTGAFTLTVKSNTGTGILVTQGKTQELICDGTNVLLASNDLVGSGISPIAGSSSITTLGTISTGTWGGSLIAGQYGGTGVANTGKTITLGGNLTTSGAFATTLTTTATTSVTLPTSGTLAISSGAQTFTGPQTFTGNITNAATSGTQIQTAYIFQAGNATSGQGGNTRYINDAGTSNWLEGLLGTAGATNFSIYDIVNSASRLTINSSTGNILIASTSDNGVDKLQVTGTAYFSSTIKVGSNITSAYSLTNDSTGNPSINATNTGTANTNGAYYAVGLTGSAYGIISTGVSNTGYWRGLQVNSLRNQVNTGDTGTLSTLYGANISYGNYNFDASTPTTTTAYGIAVQPYYKTGTVGTMYDIYLAADNTGGTVTTRRGIWQLNTGVNSLAGHLLLGTTTDDGTNQLQVTGGTKFTGALTVTGTTNHTGLLGCGSVSAATNALFSAQGSGALSSGSQNGVYSNPVGTSSATSSIIAFNAAPQTAAASFNVSGLYGLYINSASLGSGSTATSAIGISISDQTVGTNNYGIQSQISSGTNKWNIYSSGTANNAFAGNVAIGSTTAPVDALDVTGNAVISGNVSSNGTVLPYNLSQSAILFVIPSSGSIGNNGALINITALPAIYSTGAYFYFPANAISSGSSAGWYWTVPSSTTAGTIYNSTYTSGTPVAGTTTAFSTTGPGAYTQVLTAITAISISMPGGSMGANGQVDWLFSSQNDNSGAAKTYTVKLGSQTYWTQSSTSTTLYSARGTIANRGAQNVNVTLSTSYTGGVGRHRSNSDSWINRHIFCTKFVYYLTDCVCLRLGDTRRL